MNNIITLKGNKVANVSVPVIFFKSEEYRGRVFAACPALQLVTDGKNLDDAKKMFEEVFTLWLDYICEKRDVTQILKDLGWKISKSSVTPAEEIDSYGYNIRPLALTSQNISIPLCA